jgi:hypothetical protein
MHLMRRSDNTNVDTFEFNFVSFDALGTCSQAKGPQLPPEPCGYIHETGDGNRGWSFKL